MQLPFTFCAALSNLSLNKTSSVASPKIWEGQQNLSFSFNTYRAGLRYIRTLISAKKNSNFQLPYQRPSSSAHCARELFNGSNGLASLADCTRKNFFCLWGAGFL